MAQSQGWDSNPRSAAYEAAEDDRLLYPARAGTAGLEPAPFRVTGGRAVRLRHAPVNQDLNRAAGGRGAARRDTNGSRVLVRPAGTGTRPPAARSCCCTHTPTVVNERPPSPAPQKHFAPPGVLRRRGDWTIPSDGCGRLRSHPLSVPAQPDVAIEPIECRLGRDDWADAHTRGRPGAMRQAIARSG